MGDVAAILGVSTNAPTPVGTKETSHQQPSSSNNADKKSEQNTSTKPNKNLHTAFTKPVLTALTNEDPSKHNSASLPPIVPAAVKINNKFISSQKKARPWTWAPFASHARNDGLLLNHWVRAGVEYPEYPFARFNIHLDALDYKSQSPNPVEFYDMYLQDDNWTMAETDTLLELCRVFELRWPVIIDRWIGKYTSCLTQKRVEDLQHRYYTIGMILNQQMVEKAALLEAQNLQKAMGQNMSEGLKHQHAIVNNIATSASNPNVKQMVDGNGVKVTMQPMINVTGTGTTNQATFDLDTEKQRRNLLSKIWQRSKEEELEEESLRAELKLVETQLRKLKKNGGHIMAAGKNTPASSRGPSPMPLSNQSNDASFAMLDPQFVSSQPVPMSGTPYLQSGRLKDPATGGPMSINKTTLRHMEQILKELKIPDRPLPTKRVCDMYDHVRKASLTLLTLQKAMHKKESEVLARRNRLEKVAGTAVAKEAQLKAEAASKAAAEAAEKAAKEKAAAEKAAEKAAAKSKSKSSSKKGTTKKKTTTKKKPAGEGKKKRKAPAKKKKATSEGSKSSTPANTPATDSKTATTTNAPAPAAASATDENPKKRAKTS